MGRQRENKSKLFPKTISTGSIARTAKATFYTTKIFYAATADGDKTEHAVRTKCGGNTLEDSIENHKNKSSKPDMFLDEIMSMSKHGTE